MDDSEESKIFKKPESLRKKLLSRNVLADVDSYLRTAESIDDALLKVITERDRTVFPQEKIDAFVSEFLIRGAHIDAKDEQGNTPLHLAVLMGFPELTGELLEWGADPNIVNGNGQLPLEIALIRGLETDDDKISWFCRVAQIIIKEMEPARVRDTFIMTPEIHRKVDFRELLFREGMQDAGIAVLGTLIEPLSKTKRSFVVNYSLLETNKKGEVCPVPASGEVSTLEAIVHRKNKAALAHPVVRLLIESRWRKFARGFLIASFIYWLLLMGFLTTALVLAAQVKDPRHYNRNFLDIFRGISEGLTLLLITILVFEEFYIISVWKSLFIKEWSLFFFSYITLLTALFLYIIIPLRVVGSNIQWIFASLAYSAHSLIAFRFLLVIRKIGKYVLILWNIIKHDLVPFFVVFIVTLFTFTGGLYLLLREEEQKTTITTSNLTTPNTQGQGARKTMTSLDKFPSETGSYPLVFLTGIRMMIEGNKIIDYYHGFGWLGTIAHLLFLFFVVVVLGSLLIAQMNHTYSTIQQEADVLLIFNRARSVLFFQKATAGLPGIPVKKWFPTEELWRDPQKILQSLPVGEKVNVSKVIAKFERTLNTQRDLVEELRDHMMFEHRKMIESLAELLQARSR